MKKLIKDLATKSKTMAEFIRALAEYLVLKNQSLWKGTLSAGNVITVPNISKYSTIMVRTPYTDIIGYIENNRFRGWASDYSNGSNVHYDNFVLANISGETFSLLYAQYMGHINGGSHNGVVDFDISEIIGLEPKMPELLVEMTRNILGGGYCLTRLLRWWPHENIHHLEAGYRKDSVAEYKSDTNSKYFRKQNEQKLDVPWRRFRHARVRFFELYGDEYTCSIWRSMDVNNNAFTRNRVESPNCNDWLLWKSNIRRVFKNICKNNISAARLYSKAIHICPLMIRGCSAC